jgi:hypothetical protein
VVDDGTSVPGGVRRGDYLPGNDGASSNFPFHDDNRVDTRAQFAGFARIDEVSLYERRIDI